MGARAVSLLKGFDVRRQNGVDALMHYSETPEIHMDPGKPAESGRT
jgi:hypothetical protein